MFIVNKCQSYIFATSLQVWEGDSIFDLVERLIQTEECIFMEQALALPTARLRASRTGDDMNNDMSLTGVKCQIVYQTVKYREIY